MPSLVKSRDHGDDTFRTKKTFYYPKDKQVRMSSRVSETYETYETMKEHFEKDNNVQITQTEGKNDQSGLYLVCDAQAHQCSRHCNLDTNLIVKLRTMVTLDNNMLPILYLESIERCNKEERWKGIGARLMCLILEKERAKACEAKEASTWNIKTGYVPFEGVELTAVAGHQDRYSNDINHLNKLVNYYKKLGFKEKPEEKNKTDEAKLAHGVGMEAQFWDICSGRGEQNHCEAYEEWDDSDDDSEDSGWD